MLFRSVQPVIVNVTGGTASPADTAEPAEHPEGVMIPPLQQKLELMKHAAGIDSAYDDACEECGHNPCECEHSQDELSTLKRNAGIAVIQQADEDEPFEG